MKFKSTNIISRTNYFNNPRTWVVRSIQYAIAVVVLYVVDLNELQNGTSIIYVCASILALGFLLMPVDEVGYNNDNIYFIKRSFIPQLNSVKSYEISRVKRIGFYCIGRGVSVFALLVPMTNSFRVEFHNHDGSSESDELCVRKKDLQKLVSEVKLLLVKESGPARL